MSKTFLFQTIQFSQTVLFQTNQFSISTQFSSVWAIDKILSGAITPGQSGSGSTGNEGVLCIPQSSSITGTLQSDSLVSYLRHSSYSSAEMQSVYSTTLADWATIDKLVGWVYGTSTFVDYLTPNPFLYK